MSLTQRIKCLVRKNLKMSSGKIAAQCVHAALALNCALEVIESNKQFETVGCLLDGTESVVVLMVSDAKFEEAKTEMDAKKAPFHVVADAGYTEVPPGTETVICYLEDDPRTQ